MIGLSWHPSKAGWRTLRRKRPDPMQMASIEASSVADAGNNDDIMIVFTISFKDYYKKLQWSWEEKNKNSNNKKDAITLVVLKK
jgi:hypothetical protein